MDRKNSYGRKPLEELIREYTHAVDNGDWPDGSLSKKMIVNEVYARIKNTFDMLDEVPEDADQIYEMLIAPMGMERGREDGQLKEEIQEESDPLRGIREILLALREQDLLYKEKIKEAIEKYGLSRKCQVDAHSSGEEETEGDTLEKLLALGSQSETELYRLAADELEGKGNYLEAVSMVYAYEIKQLSDKPVHNAKEKIRARLKANLKLSLLLLEDGYEDAAVDNILELFR